MNMQDLLLKISELSTLAESKKETTHKGGTVTKDDSGVTKHRGKYGTEYQGDDSDDDEEDGKKSKKAKKAKAADEPKRGRGRPPKSGAHSVDPAEKKRAADREAAGKSLQSFMVGNLPKSKSGKTELPGKASKKHSLKEWFDEIDRVHLAEKATPIPVIDPATGKAKLVTLATGNPGADAIANTVSDMLKKQGSGFKAMLAPTPGEDANAASAGNTASSTSSAASAPSSGVATAMKEETMDEGDKKWIKGAIKKPGAFTAKAKAHGKSTGEFAAHVLSHKKDYPAKTEKQAVLAKTLKGLGKGKKESVEEADMPPRDGNLGPGSMSSREPGSMSPLTRGSKNEAAQSPTKSAKPAPKKSAKRGDWKNSLHESEQGVAEGSEQDDPYRGTTPPQGKKAARNAHRLGKTYTNPHSSKYHKKDHEAWERDYNSEMARLKNKGVAEGKKAKPDFLDIDDDGNERESMKSAAASAKAAKTKKIVTKEDQLPARSRTMPSKPAAPIKKKPVTPFGNQPVKEGSDSCRAAYHEGKHHAFENGHYRCRYDEGMEESRHYHRGFIEGLEECYGGGMVGEASVKDVINRHPFDTSRVRAPKGPLINTQSKHVFDTDAVDSPGRSGYSADERKRVLAPLAGQTTNEELDEQQFMAELDALDEEMVDTSEGWTADMDEMEHRGWIDKKKAEAKRAGKSTATAFGQKFPVGENMNDLDISEDPVMEGWSKQLGSILNEDAESAQPVAEGLTITTSTGQPGGSDSASVSATDEDAGRLLAILSNAGLTIGSRGAASAATGSSADYSDEGDGDPHGSATIAVAAPCDDDYDASSVSMRERPRGGGMSQNVERPVKAVTPYDYDSVSSALGSGGGIMSALRSKLLALESKNGGMEMPDGNGMSVQKIEDEPQGTPDAPQPYDVDDVQGALEKGGSRVAADVAKTAKTAKSGDSKSSDDDAQRDLEEAFEPLAKPRGSGMSVPESEPEPVAPKMKRATTTFANSKSKRKVSEAATVKGVPTLAMPVGLGVSQGGDAEPGDVEAPVAHHSDDVQDALDSGSGSKKSDKGDKGDKGGSDSALKNALQVDDLGDIRSKLMSMRKSGTEDTANNKLASMHHALAESEMPMPDGNGMSAPGKEQPMPDGPADSDVTDIADVLGDLEHKENYAQDEYEKAFAALKRMIQSQMGAESGADKKTASQTTASHNDEGDEQHEELSEGSTRCDECGAMYEGTAEDHECREDAQQLDEWSNSLRTDKEPGQIADESFAADAEYLINSISGGLNGQKFQRAGGYRNGDNPLAMPGNNRGADPLSDWLKLSGVHK